MNWNRFKIKAKENIQNHEADQDFMEIWNAIEPKVDLLNRKKKKKPFILFFLLGSTIIFGSLITYISVSKTPLVAEQAIIAPNFQKSNEISKVSRQNDSKYIDIVDPNSLSKEESIKTKSIDNSAIEKSLLNSQNNKSKSNLIKRRNAEIEKTLNVGSFTPIYFNSIKESNQRINGTKSNTLNKQEKNEKPIAIRINSQKNTKLNTDKSFPLNSIPPLNINKFELVDNVEYKLDSVLDEPITIGNKVKNKFTPKIRVNGYAFATFRNLSNKVTDTNTLLSIREQTESSLESTQIELIIEFAQLGKFSLSTGFSALQIVERLSFTDSFNETVQVEGVEFQVPNLAGGFIDINGIINEEFQTNTHYTRFNRYRFIDIPVLINYTTTIGKWNLLLEAGSYININLNSSGSVLDEQLILRTINNDELLRNSIGISFGLSTKLERSLGKNFSLQFGPSFRWLPFNIGHENNPINQSYDLLGGSAGLSYKF